MIIHEIIHPNNRRQVVVHNSMVSGVQQPNPEVYRQANTVLNQIRRAYQQPKVTNKLEHSQYLEKKGIKVGDYIVNESATPPFAQGMVHRVMYIEENFNLSDQIDLDGWPKVYYLQSHSLDPAPKWWKSSLTYCKKVERTQLPAFWVHQEELERKQKEAENDEGYSG